MHILWKREVEKPRMQSCIALQHFFTILAGMKEKKFLEN